MNYENPIFYRINYGDTLYGLASCYNVSVQDILSTNPHINPYDSNVGQTITLIPNGSISSRSETSSRHAISHSEFELMKKMRMVWSQHVYWTRLFIVSMVGNLNDLEPTTNRLLQTAKDIADIFATYYGNTIGNAIDKLLTTHLTIAADLVKASIENNTSYIAKFNKAWYDNADKIAEAFSKINLYYNKEVVRKMFYEHLDLTKEELSNRLVHNHVEEVKTFNKIEQQALMMGDYFLNGIVKQFPKFFRI